MGKIHKYLLFFFLLVCTAHSMMAQIKNKKKNKEEEVEKPPLPIEEIKEVRIDTTSTGGISESVFINDDVFNYTDTIPPPADELTAGIRKVLQLTGALNLGLELAMSLRNTSENDLLPPEFYDRLFFEFTKGESRILFENLVIKVYRKHFILEDNNMLIYFYESETGKKMLSALPKIMEESQKIGTEFGRITGLKIYKDLIKEGKIN
jgi:hypothetical protein